MSLELLLTQISNINKKYEEIYKFSGEKFNIFNLLNLSADEISHSRIIATLLNPEGMHGKDSRFLKMFLDCIGINDFSVERVIAKTEKFIGYISEDYTSGGKIDITLSNNKNQQILIENKIYAGDQRNQLLRYHEYNPNAYLLYLTLFGNDPSENSIGKLTKINYIKISYKEHILKWLELCKKESIDNPLLRETLTQYIVLIKQLTGQARSKEMQKEYLETILKNTNTLSAAFIISEIINEVKLHILEEQFLPPIKKLADKMDMNIDLSFDKCFERYWRFSFRKKEWKHFKVDFEFEYENLQDLIYGFRSCDTEIKEELDIYLRSLKNYGSSKDWPLYQYMDKYRYWNGDFYTNLFFGNCDVINVIEEKIREVLLLVENKGYEL